MKNMASIAAAALLVASLDSTFAPIGETPTPRRDRHGKRTKVPKTQYTVAKDQSEKLKRLLRK